MKKQTIILILLLLPFFVYAQAGRGVYRFLDLPASSRIAALGGNNISMPDTDLNFSFQNPALLNAETHGMMGLNFANYLADVNFGAAAFGWNFGERNFMSFGILYIDYGKFLYRTPENQSPGGDVDIFFGAQELALHIMYARPLTERVTVGGTLKPIFSSFEQYTSFGVAMDLGVSYVNPDRLFSAGFVVRNIGHQITGYYSHEDGQHFEPLAFDIQLGITQRLRYAPLRFSLTLNNLHRWDLSYQITNMPSNTLIPGDIDDNSIGFVDMAFRRAIIGVEFVPNENFYISVGYSHRRRQELSIAGARSMSGFSAGAGIRVRGFQAGFGILPFQTGLSTFHFSVSTSLNELRL